jgi:transcriptional regulator with XRE-family HTH domain
LDELHRRVVAAIRERAKQQQIALTHLPDRAGVARSHFWKVVKGTTSPTLRWVAKIAKALGVSALDLAQVPEPAKRRRR